MKLRAPAPLGMLALTQVALSACLTINDVPRKDRDPSSADGGAKHGDGASGDLDAGADGSVIGGPCVDRGAYTIHSTSVVGLAHACPSGSACVEGTCVTTPACAPSVTGECELALTAAHGPVLALAAEGDDVYWLEGGTFDARGNHHMDGTLVKMQPGAWSREEVVSGLDLSSGIGELPQVTLTVLHGHAIWQRDDVETAFEVDTTRQPATVDENENGPSVGACLANEVLYWGGPSVRMRPLDEHGSGDVAAFRWDATTGRCAATSDAIYLTDVKEGGIWRLGLDQGTLERVASEGSLEGAFGAQPVAVREVWFSTGSYIATSGKLTWKNVTGGTYIDRVLGVVDHYAYWTVLTESPRPELHAVLRGALDGVGDPQVIAENAQEMKLVAVTNTGLVWLRDGASALHFAPFPAP